MSTNLSIADYCRLMKIEYDAFVAGLPHSEPISYTDWLEMQLLKARREVEWANELTRPWGVLGGHRE